jgi:uncharacterized membrane protein YedE/YeeE
VIVYVSLVAGVLFGAGLAVGEMTNPAKVLSFLDFTGGWDPSLAFVMGAALLVSAASQILARRPGERFARARGAIPTATRIDARLLGGSVLFGLGWGLAGLCPGPAIAGLASGSPGVTLFAVSMLAGMTLHRFVPRANASASSALGADA